MKDSQPLPHSQISKQGSTASFDPLSTVKLPPPKASEAYAWNNPSESKPRVPLSENTNFLRTPDSILRLHDTDGPIKRASTSDGNHANKRTKMSRWTPSRKEHSLGDNLSSGSSTPANMWDSLFFQNIPNADQGIPNRPRTAYPAPYSRQHGHPTPSLHYSRGAMMLSPSATPYDRKMVEHGIASQTPTRADRPSSINEHRVISNNRTNFSLIANVPNPLTNTGLSEQGPLAQQPTYNAASALGQEAYGNQRPGALAMRHVDIPPPEEMPEINDDGSKPTYSYAMLIGMAILRAPERKLTLSQIYSWIMDTFEYYRNSKPTWHNSIRHNLSLNKAFEKRVRPKGDPGKGNYWTIVKGLEYQFMRPRNSKRGADTMNTSSMESSSLIAASSTSRDAESFNASMCYGGKRNVYDASAATRAYESIPSDGTEPDEGFLEEDKQNHEASLSLQYSDMHRSFVQKNQEKALSEHLLDQGTQLPQMHAMTAASSSRPQSPPTLNLNPGAAFEKIKTKEDTNSTFIRAQFSGLRNPNEWRGQGQFAFRCSTPSMIQSNLAGNPESNELTTNQRTLQKMTIPPNSLGKPKEKHHADFTEREIPPKSTEYENVETRGNWRQHSSTTPAKVDSSHLSVKSVIDFSDSPKTPEKHSKVSSCQPSSSTSAYSQLLLAPPKSFDSPYAGTLELSPGLALSNDVDGIGTPQHPASRMLQQRSSKKGSATASFADLIELEFKKPNQASGGGYHKRTGSTSSEDNEPTHTSLFTINSVGASNHANPFSASLDVDFSPRLVMTPIRRPFDTPIRDQANTYSPYCRGTTSNFGSPLRKG